MKKIIIITVFLVSIFSFAQKIKDKDGVVNVDKVDYIKFKEDKVSKGNFIISNLKGEEILYIRASSYNDPSKVEPLRYGTGYTSGDVWYYEVISADLEKIFFETHISGSPFNDFRLKYVVNNLYNGEAINADGTLNLDKLNMLSKKVGFEYTKRREAISGKNSNNTIIIKEEPRKSGININIGG
jgi:hypothetical protein